MSTRRLLWIPLIFTACSVDPPAAEPPIIHAKFDPKSGEIPTPNDALLDRTAGRLAIPAEPEDLEDKTDAEIAFIRALNERDAWPPEMEAKLSFTGVLDPRSITASSVRVFHLREAGAVPLEVELRGEPLLRPDELVVKPPQGRWLRGGRYFVVALGGQAGLRGAEGEDVVADAAFWFLRLQTPLTDHVRALPGADDEERMDNAERLEELRLELAPHFAHLERLGVARSDVVSLWSFTVSEATEVIMDKEAGEMPVPSDFLRDPATGLVDVPIHDDDSEVQTNIKRALNRMDGFGLSANLMFELTAPFDPRTLTSENVRVYALPSDPTAVPVRIDATLRARLQDTAVTLDLPEQPLEPATDHVVVLTKHFTDTRGLPIRPMLPGVLAMLDAEVYDGRTSQVGSVDSESAARVEPVRASVARAFARLEGELSRDDVTAIWPFRTLQIVEPMRRARDAAQLLELPVDPLDVQGKTPVRAALDFPLGSLTMLRVARVLDGTIMVPDFLDPLTRANREDGRWEPREVRFTMTIPIGHDEDEPLPVAIFGHGLMTERRFVLALGDALAAEGLAVIAIDLPYHGLRTHCVWDGPQCLVNPLDQAGDPICPNPCERNTTCAPDGQCVDSAGVGNHLNNWPIVGFPQASGGAFVSVNRLDGTRDHFYQAVTDLSALRRSLLEGDWRSAIGFSIDPELRYVGQSLGGVIGSLFASVQPSLRRVVLNVPGADIVDLFRESTVFSPHFEALLAREEIVAGSDEHERLLNVARWIIDPVDPASFAPYLLERSFDDGSALDGRQVLIQMATLDLVIPNRNTEVLTRLTGAPQVNYIAEHAFLVVPVEPAYLRGTRDVARLLGRGEMP